MAGSGNSPTGPGSSGLSAFPATEWNAGTSVTSMCKATIWSPGARCTAASACVWSSRTSATGKTRGGRRASMSCGGGGPELPEPRSSPTASRSPRATNRGSPSSICWPSLDASRSGSRAGACWSPIAIETESSPVVRPQCSRWLVSDGVGPVRSARELVQLVPQPLQRALNARVVLEAPGQLRDRLLDGREVELLAQLLGERDQLIEELLEFRRDLLCRLGVADLLQPAGCRVHELAQLRPGLLRRHLGQLGRLLGEQLADLGRALGGGLDDVRGLGAIAAGGERREQQGGVESGAGSHG